MPSPKETHQVARADAQGGDCDFIEHFETIEAGRYWRVVSLPESSDFERGQVLMLESVRWVDNDPHTLIVRSHPSSKFIFRERYRLEDFLMHFEFEPNGEAIRAQERLEAQAAIEREQQALTATQASRATLLAAMREDGFLDEAQDSSASTSLVAPMPQGPQVQGQSLPALMARVNTPAALDALVSTAGRMQDEATAQSKWLTHRMERISSMIQRLTPFFEEQCAAALASTENIRSDVEAIMRGLDTLGLFVGKDVICDQIAQGRSAPPEVPLTLQQRRLFVNQELSVFRAVSPTFDCTDEWRFFDALREEPDLVDQIFTAERAVVMMAVRPDPVHYGDDLAAAFKSMRLNRENLATFFLIRDGENIYRVFTPEASHEAADHLFPLNGEQDGLFQGTDCSHITFDDVRYTDALARHERYLVHYRRILVLLFGLQFREGLLGTFFPENEAGAFLTLGFQEKYFRFIRDADGDGTALGDGKPDLKKWLARHYSEIRHGSLVMGDWGALMTEETAPAAFRGYPTCEPDEAHAIAKVDLNDGRATVKIPVHSRPGYGDDSKVRSFNCTVDISEIIRYATVGLVCLDNVDPSTLSYYIHNRTARKAIVSHTMLFAEAIRHLNAQRSACDWADDAVAELSGLDCPAPAADLIVRTLSRLDGNQAPDPARQRVLAWLGKLISAPDEACAHAASLVPGDILRVDANLCNGKLEVYVAPAEQEQDERLGPFWWVKRYTVSQHARQSPKNFTWVHRNDSRPGLVTAWGDPVSIHDRAKDGPAIFRSPEDKAAHFRRLAVRAASLLDTLLEKDPADLLMDWKRDCYDIHARCRSRSRWVVNPALALPVGAYSTSTSTRTLCVGFDVIDAIRLLDRLTEGARRDFLIHHYSSRYEASQHHRDIVLNALDKSTPPCLYAGLFSNQDAAAGLFVPGRDLDGRFEVTAPGALSNEALVKVFHAKPERLWLLPWASKAVATLLSMWGDEGDPHPEANRN